MDFISMIDTLWVALAAILVFFMNLGFAAVESGFARSKNTPSPSFLGRGCFFRDLYLYYKYCANAFYYR